MKTHEPPDLWRERMQPLRSRSRSVAGRLPLLLLMLRVFADHHYIAFSLYDLAFFANFFNGWFYFHCSYQSFLDLISLSK